MVRYFVLEEYDSDEHIELYVAWRATHRKARELYDYLSSLKPAHDAPSHVRLFEIETDSLERWGRSHLSSIYDQLFRPFIVEILPGGNPVSEIQAIEGIPQAELLYKMQWTAPFWQRPVYK